jgi:tetratricopeptide (TPR) repeat protein
MQCPECRQEMQRLNRFWVCEAHDPPVSIPIQTTQTRTEHAYSKLCSQLPTPLAVPIDEFGRILDTISQGQAYRALWAMVDAAELITRFIAIVAMLDVRQQTGEIPEPLRKVLVNLLERPTFGAWREIAQVALRLLKRGSFVEELLAFWEEHWEPLLNGDSAENSLLELRNMMAHTSRFRDEDAQRLLEAHRERFGDAIMQLKFWSRYRLVAILSKERPIRLQGTPHPQHWTLPEEQDPLPHQLLEREETVALAPDDQRFLELFPLQLYNPLLVYRDNSLVALDNRPALMVYMRYNRQRQLLEYTALAPDYAFSQQQLRDAFNELFPLSEWRRELEQQQAARTEWEQEGYHFRDLIDSLTEELYGRAAHLEQVKQRLQQHRQSGGVLWIGGRPGVGKSALMAKLAKDLQGDSRAVLIPFFFRSGDHRCGADRFYRAACLRLAEQLRISLERKPNQRYADLFSEVMQRVSDALPNDKTVIFLLDGLDEGVRHEPDLPEIPLRYQSPRVVWICAGRREKSLRALWGNEKTQKLWGDGELPPLTHDDIRAWLQNELERLRYELFELDRLDGDELRNKFIEELTLRSEGLPLYVRMVIEDLKTRQFTVRDGDRLPQGLERYYDRLLARLGAGDVELVLTEVLTLLSWAQEPLAQQTIIDILVQTRSAPQSGQFVHEFSQLVNKVLEFGHTTLVQRTTPEGEWGWTLYHDSFREFLRTSERVKMTRRYMQHALLTWCAQWQTHKSPYALRHYAEHLREANEVAQLYALARDEAFAQAQREGIPHDPDLPRQTAALALQAAIETKDAPMMVEMLLLHARRVETVESPLDALRAGNPQRALKLAERILREQDYQIGTLWLLLLAWESSNRENGSEFVKQCLTLIRDWWIANRPQPLSDDWAPVVVEILLQFPCAQATEMAIILQDEAKADLVRGLLESGLCPLDERVEQALAAAERIENAYGRSSAYRAVALALAQAGLAEQALAAAERIENADRRSEAYRAVALALAQAGQVEQALAAAERIEDAYRRSEAYRAVAEALVQAGQIEQAQKAFQQALAAAERIKDAFWRSWAYGAVALALAQAGQIEQAQKAFQQALAAAERIKDAFWRSEAYRAVALALAQAGQIEQAQKAFQQALAAAERIKDADWRSDAYRAVALALVQAGQIEQAQKAFQQALAAAERIENAYGRSSAYRAVALALAQAGQVEQALAAAERIEDACWRSEAYGAVALALAQAGQVEQALAAAERIEDAFWRSSAYRAVALALAQAGQVEQALAAAERIEDAFWCSSAYGAVALALAQAGQIEQAQKAFQQALAAAERIENAYRRSEAYGAVALALAQAGQVEQALAAAERIEEADERSRAYGAVALALAQAGQIEQAQKAFQQALAAAERIEDAYRRSEAYRAVALALAQAGQAEQALAAAERIEDAYRRSEAYREVALALAQAGQIEQAQEAFQQALAAAERIENAYWRSEAYREVALALAQAGQIEQAQEAFQQALAAAERIENAYWRSRAYGAVALALAQAGQAKQALAAAERIEDAFWRSRAYGAVALALAQAGQIEQAQEAFQQALAAAERIEEADERSRAYGAVALALAQAGQIEQAQEAFQQALAAAERIENAYGRSWAYRAVALALAQAGQPKQALAAAERIEDAFWRSEAYRAVALALAQAGQIEQAQKAFQQALAAAERIEDADWRSWAYGAVALALAQAGQAEQAQKALAQALEVARQISSPGSRYDALWQVARASAEMGAGEVAKQLVVYELPVGRGENLPAIMSVLAQRGDTATFLALLPLCGWSRVMAFKVCLLIATLYPEHNLAVLKLLARELGVGRDGESDSEKIS